MAWVPIWDQAAVRRDLDSKIFSVKQHIPFNHQEESRILTMSRKYQNPLWWEYNAASKYEQGHGEVVPWKKVISLCLTIGLPDSSVVPVQSINLYMEKHVSSTDIFASRHKTILVPSNRTPPEAALHHYMAVWKQKWCWSHQPQSGRASFTICKVQDQYIHPVA